MYTTIMDKIKYHKEVYFEANAVEAILKDINKFSSLTYTRHAQLETIKDRYQTIPVLTLKDLKPEYVFEYTKENNKVIKAAFRVTHLSDIFDFSYSVSLDGKVLTCWANKKSDTHRTLDSSLYQSS